jgi:hypothetical protein
VIANNGLSERSLTSITLTVCEIRIVGLSELFCDICLGPQLHHRDTQNVKARYKLEESASAAAAAAAAQSINQRHFFVFAHLLHLFDCIDLDFVNGAFCKK